MELGRSNPPLPPGQQLAAPHKWPLVGERAPRDDDAPWTLTLTGAAVGTRVWTLDALRALPLESRAIDIHCVTRWSKLAVPFRGVPLATLLDLAPAGPEARFVSFVARSARGHSTSLPLDDALRLDTLLALECDGAPLPTERGGPLRGVVPGRYFYKSVKWLERIDLLPDDRLGYWEAEAGYHNTADPWRQQRYMAPGLSRHRVAELLATRDWRGLDLRGIAAAERDLARLDAHGALLRDADLRRANLAQADFSAANLSNAHLAGASLPGASFANADLEGADLAGSDLRGADLRGASLLGATLFSPEDPAATRLDGATRFDHQAAEALLPEQAELLHRALAALPGE